MDDNGQRLLRGQRLPRPEELVIWLLSEFLSRPHSRDVGRGTYGYISNMAHPPSTGSRACGLSRFATGRVCRGCVGTSSLEFASRPRRTRRGSIGGGHARHQIKQSCVRS